MHKMKIPQILTLIRYLAEYYSLGVGNLCVFVVWVFGDTLEQIC